ncbi:MAG: TrkA family potassium uptake protein [Oscillospiraceae bacterium]|nr:TrkA family potassium uptake protein [Oscillospiraceae bacterium]
MNILIVGCGKVGSQLANLLDSQGHDVVIVDPLAENFDLLDPDFSGYTVTGLPIDQDILRQAGIEGCDVVAAVTREDNVNIMVSEVASKIFNIKNIITRIYDPHRESTFSKFGLKTICPTNMTVAAICASINNEINTQELHFDNFTVSFSVIKVPKQYVGKHISIINENSDINEKLFGVISDNNIIFSQDCDFKLKETDQLIFSRITD